MAKVSELFEAPRAAYYAKVLELVKAEFKKQTGVTDIHVKGAPGWNSHIEVRFKFNGATVVANVSETAITDGSRKSSSTLGLGFSDGADIRLDGYTSYASTAEFMAAVSEKYRGYLKDNVERIRVEALDGETYNRKQRLFLTQQMFLDEGYEATAKFMPSGQMRLVITHQLLPGPLREVIVE